MKTLSEYKQGDTLKVLSVEDTIVGNRLMEMGILPGEVIKIELIAPFKDPISISVSGFQLSLRKSDAQLVKVEHLN